MWKLPKPGTDFRAWLDELTDAVIDADHQLAWPWQHAGSAQ
jgi:hypothetical protein